VGYVCKNKNFMNLTDYYYYDVQEHLNVVKDVVTSGEYIMIRHTLFLNKYKDDKAFDTLTEKAERETLSIIIKNEVFTKSEYDILVQNLTNEVDTLNKESYEKRSKIFQLQKYSEIFKKVEETE
jgi:hypothetical protein